MVHLTDEGFGNSNVMLKTMTVRAREPAVAKDRTSPPYFTKIRFDVASRRYGGKGDRGPDSCVGNVLNRVMAREALRNWQPARCTGRPDRDGSTVPPRSSIFGPSLMRHVCEEANTSGPWRVPLGIVGQKARKNNSGSTAWPHVGGDSMRRKYAIPLSTFCRLMG